MKCETGKLVGAIGLNHRRSAGAFVTTYLGIQRLSRASLGAVSAAFECASLSALGSSQGDQLRSGWAQTIQDQEV